MKQKQIVDVAKRMAGGTEESKQYLPYYSAAKQMVKESLTETERTEINIEIKRQREEGIPRKKQAE